MGGNVIEFEALRIKREGQREESIRVALDMIHDGYSGKEIMKIARKSRKEIDELAKSKGLVVDWEEKAAAN